MSLDPDIKQTLERMAATKLPPMTSLPPSEARKMFDMTAPVLDARNVPIGSVEDRKIPGPGGEIPIRIYSPTPAVAAPAPALVFYHGGGFVVGSIQSHDAPCRLLSNAAGCKIISVDYRLAPEHKFPAAVEDCVASLKWVRDHAAEIGVDPARLAVGGDSAGGNLTAVICHNTKGAAPKLKAQLLIYPTTDATTITESRRKFSSGYFLESEMMDWFFNNYTRSEADRHDPRFSPILYADFSDLPPTIVITAGFDPLLDEGKAYADKLKSAGVPVIYKNYEGMIHGFWNMSGVAPAAGEAIKETAVNLKRLLG